MNEAEIVNHAAEALVLVLVLSLPPIVVAAAVGVFISLIQALTQLQEQTISFVFKLISVIVVLLATTSWLGAELFSYAAVSFDRIETLGYK